MSLPKLKELNGNVMIEPIKKQEKRSEGGIIIPEIESRASRGRLERGRVVVVEESEVVRVGDIVYHAKGAGNEVIFDGKTYLIIPILQLKLVEPQD